MAKVYVEKRDGGYRMKGTRISLDSIVYAFKRGASPETIKRNFPVLTLEEVYGAITFYLANEKKIDLWLQESDNALEAEAEKRRQQVRMAKPELIKRLQKARQESEVGR